MEGKRVCKTLPDHLVERIIAMTPFPAIFQARCLSKSWRARFSAIASQDDEQMKRIASSFQKVVSERSMNWGRFCPVFFGTNGDLVAYDKKTNNWRKLPSVSFLPKNVLTGLRFGRQIEGALLYAYRGGDDIYVANILTRTWKHLPRPPISGDIQTSKLLVTDKESYKVILFCQRDLYPTDLVFVQIYDSKSCSWSSITADLKFSFDHDAGFMVFHSVYFDGNLYISRSGLHMDLIVFNVRHGTFEQLRLRLSGRADLDWAQYPWLVVCEDELLMVTSQGDCGIPSMVMRIDLKSSTVIPLNDDFGPLEASSRVMPPTVMPPVGDDEHIFFVGEEDRSSRMRAYNVKADLWSSAFTIPTFSEEFPSGESKYDWVASFQPGFGPFVAV